MFIFFAMLLRRQLIVCSLIDPAFNWYQQVKFKFKLFDKRKGCCHVGKPWKSFAYHYYYKGTDMKRFGQRGGSCIVPHIKYHYKELDMKRFRQIPGSYRALYINYYYKGSFMKRTGQTIYGTHSIVFNPLFQIKVQLMIQLVYILK